jgi:hypothetical protein
MKARRARAFAALERELVEIDGNPLSVYERTQLELCVVLHDKAARGRLNDRNSERAGSTSHRILTASSWVDRAWHCDVHREERGHVSAQL